MGGLSDRPESREEDLKRSEKKNRKKEAGLCISDECSGPLSVFCRVFYWTEISPARIFL